MAAPSRERLTAAEFDAFAQRPENADKLFEFIVGEIVEVPSNPYSSHIASRINRRLSEYVEDNKLGYVTGEQGGYQVAGERYAPDVAFISYERQPELARTGYNPQPPELAVEVISPSDKQNKLAIKVANYLLVGTVVWLVAPEEQTINVLIPGEKARELTIDDTLDGAPVLPGFTLAVKKIFPQKPGG